MMTRLFVCWMLRSYRATRPMVTTTMATTITTTSSSNSLLPFLAVSHPASTTATAYCPSSSKLFSTSISSSSSEELPIISNLATSIQESLVSLLNTTGTITPKKKKEKTKPKKLVIVLSVSGGCDSVAMFHACMELRTALQQQQQQQQPLLQIPVVIQWHVVHFHHRQRGESANQDCQLVKDLANEYQIKFHLEDWNDFDDGGGDGDDANKNSQTSIAFSQNSARTWRRQRLLEYTKQQVHNYSDTDGNDDDDDDDDDSCLGVIMMAHHKDDSQESILLKLLRGVHVLNIKGIEPMTKLTATSDDGSSSGGSIWLARPWLGYSKEDLIDYLQIRQRTWREDDSNASPKYLRNRVRNELLPLLEDLMDGNLDRRIQNLVKQSHDLQIDTRPRIEEYYKDHVINNNKFLWKVQENGSDGGDTTATATAGGNDLIQSQALHQFIQNQVIQQSSSSSYYSVSYETLQRILDQLYNHPNNIEWKMDIGSHFQLQRKGVALQVVTDGDDDDDDDSMTPIWSWSLHSTAISSSSSSSSSACLLANNDKSLTITVPKESITNGLTFRCIRVREVASGSKFLPPWRETPVKLRSFLRGQDIPFHERDDIKVLLLSQQQQQQEEDGGDDDSKSSGIIDSGDTDVVVAVAVQRFDGNSSSWIIGKEYEPKTSTVSSSTACDQILLTLRESPE